MKLVSINAVLIASANISLFINCYIDEHSYPPLSLFLLSLVFIALIILLQYEHRQFKQSSINIRESSFLHRNYLFLFAAGLFLTLSQKYDWLKSDEHYKLKQYTLLSGSIHYSLLYYGLNVVLGLTYQYLFFKQYQKANRSRVAWYQAEALNHENCSICLLGIEEGQKRGKIECMHLFHLGCLNKWLKQKAQCPVCKSQIILLD